MLEANGHDLAKPKLKFATAALECIADTVHGEIGTLGLTDKLVSQVKHRGLLHHVPGSGGGGGSGG